MMATTSAVTSHPSGRLAHGFLTQVFRGLAFAIYFTTCCVA